MPSCPHEASTKAGFSKEHSKPMATGPRTEAGKTRSSLNSTKHGLTSTKVLLPYESEEEYNTLRDSLIEEYAPVNDLELTLATIVVETLWRRQRFYRIETAFLNQRMSAIMEAHPEVTDGDGALSTLFQDPAEIAKSRLMLRYLTAAERAHKSAVSHLEKVQKARRATEAEEAEEMAAAPAEFVSQNSSAPSEPAAQPFGKQKKSRRLTRRERRQLVVAQQNGRL